MKAFMLGLYYAITFGLTSAVLILIQEIVCFCTKHKANPYYKYLINFDVSTQSSIKDI